MVHSVTGQAISSYKKLMNDPDKAEIWQIGFGKDFGGLEQGGNEIRQKGTNAMFVMNHNEIGVTLKDGNKITHANLVVDHRPQKVHPTRIHITAGENLIEYDSKLSVPTADINTAKLHWNSVVSTDW
jgi:hypothetical protein